uniref:HMG-CoA lyase-like protein n=1 Tax=Streptomyces fradiae TaxID=1906 RepID=D2SNE9_STRFR|nr:HMG-CoA lyase-like protein [Streptomyces fradiae]
MTRTAPARSGPGPAARVADVQVTDVTLRDGGYLNDHSWTADRAHAVVRAVSAAGVRRIEVGYANAGAAFPSPALLGDLVAAAGPATVVMMVKPFGDEPDWAALAGRGVGAVRFPVAVARAAELGPVLDRARRAGLETAVNLIRVSAEALDSVVGAAVAAAELGAGTLYVADSNGSLTPHATDELVRALCRAVPVPIGFHGHDNLRLALANSLAALRAGAAHVDASFDGIGKGGGNLVLELLLAYLRSRGRDDFTVRPLAPLAQVLREETTTRRRQESAAWAAGLFDLDIDQAGHLFSRSFEHILAFVDAAPHREPDRTGDTDTRPSLTTEERN